MDKWQRAARRLVGLQDELAAAGGDLDRALQAIVEAAAFILPAAEGIAIETVDGADRVVRIGQGLCGDTAGVRRPYASGLTGLALRTGTVQASAEVAADARCDQATARLLGVGSVIVAPLPPELDPPGVLVLCSGQNGAFDEGDAIIARLLAAPLHYVLARNRATGAMRAFEATFEQAAVGMAHVTPDGGFLRVNRRFCEITGYDERELLVDGFQRITHADDLIVDLANVDDLLAGRIHDYAMEKRYVRKDGTLVWVTLTVSLVRKADGAPDFMVSVVEDISARKRAESLASYDPLTGLPNRRMIVDRLDEMLARQASGGPRVALAFLDLDNFKAVNDRRGHFEGDRCLTAVAAALDDGIRQQDLLGRYGGDEFVLLMAGITEQEAAVVLDRLAAAIRRLSLAHGWGIGISIGAVLAGRNGLSADALLAAADTLMYGVKRGSGPVAIRTVEN